MIKYWLEEVAPVNLEAILIDLARFNQSFNQEYFHAELKRKSSRSETKFKNKLGKIQTSHKVYLLEFIALKRDFKNCQVTIIPQFKEEHYFYAYRRHFEKVSFKKNKDKQLEFRSALNFYVGTARVHNCEDDPSRDIIFQIN